MRTVERPAAEARLAHQRPTMPAPTMTRSGASGSVASPEGIAFAVDGGIDWEVSGVFDRALKRG